MGKSKSRILRKGINNQLTTMSRSDAAKAAARMLNSGNIPEAKDIITLFGLGAEEVLESGASYESVVAVKNIFSE